MWHDDDYGGQGPHCHTNAQTTLDPDTTSGQTYEHDPTKGKLCTMFFRDDSEVEPDGKFCATACVPRLKRVNLDKTHMKAQGWGRF